MKNEKENSAIEKTEEIADQSAKTSSGAKNGSQNKKTSGTKNAAGKKKPRIDKKAEHEQFRAEKAKAKAEKKEELKILDQKKKEMKLESKLARKQADLNKKENLKKLKQEKREASKARKQMIKNESKPERATRIRAEKIKKEEIKNQAREKKAEVKIRKEENKRQIKREKEAIKAQQKKQGKSNATGGWLAAVISLGCAVLVLGSLLTLSMFSDVIHIKGTTAGTAATERSYYDFVGYVDNLEVNMSKLMVSSDNENQQKILSDIRVQSNLASASLAALPLEEENKYYTSKYINQLGDYSRYLNNQLISGKNLSDKDYTQLKNFYNINTKLKSELSGLSGSMDEKYDFKSLLNGKEQDMIISKFKEIEEASMDYPKMIYDGPFADSEETASAKGLTGDEISSMDALNKFKEYFADYKIKQSDVVGEAVSETIACYNINAKTEGDYEIYAQISKIGGNIVMFNSYNECTETKFDKDKCVQTAEAFLKKVGFDNMKAVWINENDNMAHINFAYEQNGIIIYSDLVKVNVCQDKGIVMGIEAGTYFLNHTERTVGSASHTETEARNKVESKIIIDTSRLSIIPLGSGSEVLAYEFAGTYDGSTYYVYVDAETLREVEIFKVVSTNEGTLLM